MANPLTRHRTTKLPTVNLVTVKVVIVTVKLLTTMELKIIEPRGVLAYGGDRYVFDTPTTQKLAQYYQRRNRY